MDICLYVCHIGFVEDNFDSIRTFLDTLLELLTEQIQGRLEVTDRENPAREWILIVPAGIR